MKQKVLIIDDSQPIHTLVRARLAEEQVEIISAGDGETGLRLAAETLPDVILLDVEMPSPDGFEVCRRLKENLLTQAIPVIFLTGVSSTDEKIHGLNLGAVDYVIKPFEPAELRARVRASLRTKYLMDLLARKAMIDGLTGLWNRAYFQQRMSAETSQSLRQQRLLSCIMADVDHFKKINDAFGHPYGDEVLRQVAAVLLEVCRAEDIVCRYGGEEFVILTPGVGTDGAMALAERLREQIATMSFHRRCEPLQVTCSFGVASNEHTSNSSLVKSADDALYTAKRGGRNKVMLAEAMKLRS